MTEKEDTSVGLPRRKMKSTADEGSADDVKTNIKGEDGSKWLKKRSSSETKTKGKGRAVQKDDRHVFQDEIDNILICSDQLNDLFGLSPEDRDDDDVEEEGDCYSGDEELKTEECINCQPKDADTKGETDVEPSLAKLAGIDIEGCDRRASQEECLKNWMERRLQDENKPSG